MIPKKDIEAILLKYVVLHAKEPHINGYNIESIAEELEAVLKTSFVPVFGESNDYIQINNVRIDEGYFFDEKLNYWLVSGDANIIIKKNDLKNIMYSS